MLVFLSLSSVCLDFWFVATVRYNIALYLQGFPDGSVVKNLPAKAGDMGSIPGSRRFPGGENGNPLQYSCLGNPMERSLVEYSPGGHRELDTSEHMYIHG